MAPRSPLLSSRAAASPAFAPVHAFLQSPGHHEQSGVCCQLKSQPSYAQALNSFCFLNVCASAALLSLSFDFDVHFCCILRLC